MTIPWVGPGDPLPDPESALREPNGLLAAGRDLGVRRLRDAYTHGIFPWYSQGQPVLWWSPDPRMVLFLDEFSISRSLAKTLRRLRREQRWRVTLDRVRGGDARVRGTAPPVRTAPGSPTRFAAPTARLHRAGHRALGGGLGGRRSSIGGLYGVSIGRMFFGESMFTRRTDASKIALAAWCRRCWAPDFA